MRFDDIEICIRNKIRNVDVGAQGESCYICQAMGSAMVRLPDYRPRRISGLFVGYAGGIVASWSKPPAKFEQRTAEIAFAGISTTAGTKLYNVKVATVTSYVEQLCPAIDKYTKLEKSAIEKTLHYPPQHIAEKRGFEIRPSWHDEFCQSQPACRCRAVPHSCPYLYLLALRARCVESGEEGVWTWR